MISALTIQFIMIVVAIGLLGLVPVILINRRSSKVDKQMYDKNFDASEELSAYKADDEIADEEPDHNKKLKTFKVD